MKREIKNILFLSSAVVLLLFAIGFAGVKSSTKPVKGVTVIVKDQQGDYFITEHEVMDLLYPEQAEYVADLDMSQLDLKMLEQQVVVHPFVKDAEVFKDIKGNVMVVVEQREPIARIWNKQGQDQYIDIEGELLPTSSGFTARVPFVELERSFSWENNISETDYGNEVLNLLKYIYQDKFWKAQIAQVVVQKDGELILLPQVSKQEIVFGMPTDLDQKFRKLMVFYKQILPNKGWNSYSMVNLKFNNQIVCE